MTKLLCIIGLFLLPFDGFGQLPVFSEDTPDFLYQGMDNVVSVTLNQVDSEMVSFKATNSARISKYSDSLFAVYPSQIDTESVLKLYYKNIIVQQKNVKILPNLQLSIFLKKEKGGIIKIIDIKDFHEIMLSDSNQGFEDKKNYRLISAGLTIYNEKGQIIYSGNLRENILNDQVKEALQKLLPGSRLVISNPRAVNQFNQSVQVEAFKEWIVTE